MSKVVKSYKGFNKDMTCRGFQYKEGKEYKTSKAVVCNEGFHACEHPLVCLDYYPPNTSIYHEVEQTGEFSSVFCGRDSKIASTKIKIGAKLSIAGLVQAAIDFTKSKTVTMQDATEDYGVSSATGDSGVSSATGNSGVSSATGSGGVSSATGNSGVSSATGICGASSATGDYGVSSATGDCGASSATGDCGASSATGYKGASSADNSTAVAVAWGYKSKAKGCIGAHIVCAEWKYDKFKSDWFFVGAKMSIVDGVKIKADTYYTLRDGEFVEVEE